MMTIQNLSSSRDPYTQVLKAKVIKVSPLGWKRHQTAGGLELMKLTVMLADPTGYVKAVVFGEKFGHLPRWAHENRGANESSQVNISKRFQVKISNIYTKPEIIF